MVHNHWCVGFRLQSVTCTAYAWCQRDGDHTRGLRRHTECAFSYGSGAWGQGGSSDTWNGYRDGDAHEQGESNPQKIDECDNFADPQTKYLVGKVWARHLHYTHNLEGEPPPVAAKSSKKVKLDDE